MIRTATQADTGDIMSLLRNAPYRHVHADWHLPVDWLGTPGFVVLPQETPASRQSFAATLFGPHNALQACLAAMADPPPAAWVRVVAIADVVGPETVLAALLDSVLPYLQTMAVTELAWLVVDEWPNAWLPDLGFAVVNEIETYLKDELFSPPVRSIPGLVIRPARLSDMPALAELEMDAFEPIWRHSAETLAVAQKQAMSFDVALLDEQIVGFQFSTKDDYHRNAHLARLTVRMDMQGQGIGSALLAQAIEAYRRHGLRQVSLNTQVDNVASQRLYRKFGFYASDQRLPVWVKNL